jgi:hypothetical protein
MAMVLRMSAIALVLSSFSLPALAAFDEASSKAAAAVEGAKSGTPEDKMVCKSKREHRTGSNLRPGRECKKESEWKAREVAAQRELTRIRDKSQTHGQALGR